jgi:putative membrane protein
MTNLRIVSALATASVLTLAGCSNDEKTTESGYEPSVSEGSEQAANPPARWVGEPGEEEQRSEAERNVGEPELAAPEPAEEEQQGAMPGNSSQPIEAQQAGAKAGEELTDGEIAKITEVVNSGEIKQAQLAKTKASSPKVKQFATHMISAHSKAKQDGAKLIKQEKLVPEESSVATEIENGATQTLEALKSGDKASFDRRYIDAQVEQHQKVLDMLDKQLIPSAKAPELKAELEKSRGMVEKHLEEAKELQGSLTEETK